MDFLQSFCHHQEPRFHDHPNSFFKGNSFYYYPFNLYQIPSYHLLRIFRMEALVLPFFILINLFLSHFLQSIFLLQHLFFLLLFNYHLHSNFCSILTFLKRWTYRQDLLEIKLSKVLEKLLNLNWFNRNKWNKWWLHPHAWTILSITRYHFAAGIHQLASSIGIMAWD